VSIDVLDTISKIEPAKDIIESAMIASTKENPLRFFRNDRLEAVDREIREFMSSPTLRTIRNKTRRGPLKLPAIPAV
jgi:hypothetical protein